MNCYAQIPPRTTDRLITIGRIYIYQDNNHLLWAKKFIIMSRERKERGTKLHDGTVLQRVKPNIKVCDSDNDHNDLPMTLGYGYNDAILYRF